MTTCPLPIFDTHYFWKGANEEKKPKIRQPPVLKESKQTKPLVIDLYIMLQKSLSYEYVMSNYSKDLSMMRINACYEIAEILSKTKISNRVLSTLGMNKNDAHSDCVNGMSILPSTLIFVCYVQGRNVLHKKKDCYFWEVHNASTQNVTVIDYDKMTLLEDTDPSCIVNTCIRVSNIAKPLKSIHSYKLSEMQEYQKKLSQIPNTLSTKKEIYEALQGIMIPF